MFLLLAQPNFKFFQDHPNKKNIQWHFKFWTVWKFERTARWCRLRSSRLWPIGSGCEVLGKCLCNGGWHRKSPQRPKRGWPYVAILSYRQWQTTLSIASFLCGTSSPTCFDHVTKYDQVNSWICSNLVQFAICVWWKNTKLEQRWNTHGAVLGFWKVLETTSCHTCLGNSTCCWPQSGFSGPSGALTFADWWCWLCYAGTVMSGNQMQFQLSAILTAAISDWSLQWVLEKWFIDTQKNGS